MKYSKNIYLQKKAETSRQNSDLKTFAVSNNRVLSKEIVLHQDIYLTLRIVIFLSLLTFIISLFFF
jgi:hypothetical protein